VPHRNALNLYGDELFHPIYGFLTMITRHRADPRARDAVDQFLVSHQ
jgi:hypothetical protein